MNALLKIHKIIITAQLELRRQFLTSTGWLLLLVASILWWLIYSQIILNLTHVVDNSQYYQPLKNIFEKVGFADISEWRNPQLGIYWNLSILLIPTICMLFFSDILASSKKSGSLRFILMRTSTTEFIMGRYIGRLVSLLVIFYSTLLSLIFVLLIDDVSQWYKLIDNLPMLIFYVAILCLPASAFMLFCSLVMNTASKALFLAAVFYIVIKGLLFSLDGAGSYFYMFNYLIPGTGFSDLKNYHQWPPHSIWLTSCLQCAAYLSASIILIKRIEL